MTQLPKMLTKSLIASAFTSAVAMIAVSPLANAADCSAELKAYTAWRAAHSGPDPVTACDKWAWCMEVNEAKAALIDCQCEGNEDCVKHNTKNCGSQPPGCD